MMSRRNLSEELAMRLRELVLDGTLTAGERINEVHLAALLQVSRTPLREALMQLVAEDLIVSLPRRGFFVSDMSEQEFRSLYSIRAILDPEALRLSGIPAPAKLKRLVAMNGRIRLASDPIERIQLDDEWHLELLADCPNHILIDLIRQFMRRTRRYELALMREQQNVGATVEHHKRIIGALRNGDLPKACAELKGNMQSGIEPILEWILNRKKINRKNTLYETNKK